MQDTEELKAKIEKARLKLNASIQSRENLQEAYENSVEVDLLIEEYIKRLQGN